MPQEMKKYLYPKWDEFNTATDYESNERLYLVKENLEEYSDTLNTLETPVCFY